MIESSFVSCVGIEYVALAEEPWMPQIGEVVYSPDLLSLKLPVAKLVWKGSDSDMNLLVMKFIYRTQAAAMAKYRLLKAIAFTIAEDER